MRSFFILVFVFVQAHRLAAQSALNDVIMNEFVVNPQVGKEWVELLVTKNGGVDMRNWRITDLSSPGGTPGAAEGILTFPDAPYLASVPQGARVLVVLSTPAVNSNLFVQDTIPADGSLVLFSGLLAGGVLAASGTIDAQPNDNGVLVNGPLNTGTIIDIISWGGHIIGWPPGLWVNNLNVTAGNGAYFTNDTAGNLNNDDGTIGWFSNVSAANLTPGEMNTNQLPPNTRRWAGVTSDWTTTTNWYPAGSADGANIIIPQYSVSPVLSTASNVLTLQLLNGGVFNVASTGVLTVINDVSIDSSAAFSIGSTGTLSVGSNFLIDGTVQITAPVAIDIGDALVLNGTLDVGPNVAAVITCRGNWARGAVSSFNAGHSKFIFTNPSRTLFIDRGNFYDLVIGSALEVNVVGNLRVENTLTLDNPLTIASGDTLFIDNPNPASLIDSTGGGTIVQGTVRRAIDSLSTGSYRFHHTNAAFLFHAGSAPPLSVAVTTSPQTIPDTTGGRRFYVNRFYDIAGVGGGAFTAELVLRYEQSDVAQGVEESTLRFWRSTDNGLQWIHVGGVVDTVNNFVLVDTVREFSKWGFGTSASPIVAVEDKRLLPAKMYLAQNFPNPFNPSTTIRYNLSRSGFVTLTVYNVLGQRVTSLIEAYHDPGNYEIEWDAHGLSSGLYFYRLQVGGYTQSRRMMLVK